MDGALEDTPIDQSPKTNSLLPEDISAEPPSPGFPTPPRMVTPPPEEPKTPSSDVMKEGLSFDNPLANIPIGGTGPTGMSDDEDDMDFTDADAAIDKMLDDLQDFQNVSPK